MRVKKSPWFNRKSWNSFYTFLHIFYTLVLGEYVKLRKVITRYCNLRNAQNVEISTLIGRDTVIVTD